MVSEALLILKLMSNIMKYLQHRKRLIAQNLEDMVA